MIYGFSLMAQSKDERKAAIAKAVAANRAANKKDKKRVDVYVQDSTKDGLKTIKATYPDVKNEGQAVDKAVQLALENISSDSSHIDGIADK